MREEDLFHLKEEDEGVLKAGTCLGDWRKLAMIKSSQRCIQSRIRRIKNRNDYFHFGSRWESTDDYFGIISVSSSDKWCDGEKNPGFFYLLL